jgi:hypothetical protein
VIPLEPEFIVPQDGAEKQDCENAAAKRWLATHGARYARLNPIYLGVTICSPASRWPLACFAGIWTRWTSVRKVKEGETTNDIFGFLTTEPNKEVGAIHPKAMPVILTTRQEIDLWMTAPAEDALKLQRPLTDGALMIVARGEKTDEGGLAA